MTALALTLWAYAQILSIPLLFAWDAWDEARR